MIPLREAPNDELEQEAAQLLARGAELPAWNPEGRRAVWDRIAREARASRRSLRDRLGWELTLALAVSCGMLAFALIHARSRPPPRVAERAAASAVTTPSRPEPLAWEAVDLGSVGTLRVRAKTVYRLPAAGAEARIELASGALCAEVAHRDPAALKPLLVETAQFQVAVIGTKFCVDAHQGVSRVTVSEGRVRVRTSSSEVIVGPGESLGSDDARLRAPAPTVPATSEARAGGPARGFAGARASSEPGSLPASAAPRPLAGPSPTVAPASAPSALATQNALFAQGTLAHDRHDGPEALRAWRSYLLQFPQGVLAPEASAGILGELVSTGRDLEALDAADGYLATYPADGRAAEVAFIRGNILHEKLGRTADALAAYRRALALATRPTLRDDALFAVGVCQRLLGLTGEARETFKRYQLEFPNGTHAAELSKWLAP